MYIVLSFPHVCLDVCVPAQTQRIGILGEMQRVQLAFERDLLEAGH